MSAVGNPVEPPPGIYDHEHKLFRESFRAFLHTHVIAYPQRWEEDGIVPRDLYNRAGQAGFLGMAIPEEFGGAGVEEDFRFNAIIAEEAAYAGVISPTLGITLHNDVCLPYLLEYCEDAQRARWLPGLASGQVAHGDRDDRAGNRARTCSASRRAQFATATAAGSVAPRRSSPTESAPTS